MDNSIENRVRLIETLFHNLDIEIAEFQEKTHLSCIAGCGKCCSTPEIDASPVEFLPWAFHVFLNGKAEETLSELEQNTTATCFLYHPKSLAEFTMGNCSNYQYRGLICRLFGFGATTDKYGKLRIATCNIIKEKQTSNFESATIAINTNLSVPIFTEYYMQLSQIDFKLGNIFLPVNKAMKAALEEVLQYYAYRPLPDGHIDVV
ncbi:YkgJ family cysteine cluster protein [uncultured Flavobacterium sp.]|uniref:YkgJ family cysteine cluster protein n=1 Tax=uncultured Flavobacterium sp. TaxID=165435 RepID=UPI00259223A8|nr:YkgJ family cysteine cluster protein [uncultured Flavobacterium sp.]